MKSLPLTRTVSQCRVRFSVQSEVIQRSATVEGLVELYRIKDRNTYVHKNQFAFEITAVRSGCVMCGVVWHSACLGTASLFNRDTMEGAERAVPEYEVRCGWCSARASRSLRRLTIEPPGGAGVLRSEAIPSVRCPAPRCQHVLQGEGPCAEVHVRPPCAGTVAVIAGSSVVWKLL